jgi:hypothetical protein
MRSPRNNQHNNLNENGPPREHTSQVSTLPVRILSRSKLTPPLPPRSVTISPVQRDVDWQLKLFQQPSQIGQACLLATTLTTAKLSLLSIPSQILLILNRLRVSRSYCGRLRSVSFELDGRLQPNQEVQE